VHGGGEMASRSKTGQGQKGGDNILYFKYHVLLRAKVSKLDRKTTNKGFFYRE
jgi:hypothetical protein